MSTPSPRANLCPHLALALGTLIAIIMHLALAITSISKLEQQFLIDSLALLAQGTESHGLVEGITSNTARGSGITLRPDLYKTGHALDTHHQPTPCMHTTPGKELSEGVWKLQSISTRSL